MLASQPNSQPELCHKYPRPNNDVKLAMCTAEQLVLLFVQHISSAAVAAAVQLLVQSSC
jgi:hypothetical protein